MTTQTKDHLEKTKKREELNEYLRTVESIVILEVDEPDGGRVYLDIELWRNRRTGKKFYRNEYRIDKQPKDDADDALTVLNKYAEQANNAVWQFYGIFGAVKNQLTVQEQEKYEACLQALTQAMTKINGDNEQQETAPKNEEQDNDLPF